MTRGRAIPRTEERIFPPARRASDRMLAEHLARYRFVAESLCGRVLDIGCGTGYGCGILAAAEGVREVVGVDVSDAALGLARRYYSDPKVTYQRADLLRRDWADGLGRFDAVTAFEVIEHLEDETAFWSGVESTLGGGHPLWLSTPLGRGRGRPVADPFHVHQLTRSEVESLFADGWRAHVYGQTADWIEPWVAGRKYYTILVRAIRAGGER